MGWDRGEGGGKLGEREREKEDEQNVIEHEDKFGMDENIRLKVAC